MAQSPIVSLLSLATAAPPHVLQQDVATEVARTMFVDRFASFEDMVPVFENTGVKTRRISMPMEWYFEPRGWPERTQAYLEVAEALFVEAAGKALAAAGLSGADVDAVVTVSSTGIATPSLDARVMAKMGFRRDIQRTPVFGLGCAGGVSGLALAGRIAKAQPGATVLFVTIELCTLAFRLDELTKANIVATALFGDGAAACVLRAGGDGGDWLLEGGGEHTWPDTLDIMGWNVDPQGFGVIFARAIPPFARRHMGAAADAILAGMGLARADVGRFVCHPGGAKVVQALEGAYGLGAGSLDVERQVLAEFGNMSAPTALFVLERVLAGDPQGRLLLTALGPGFTASALSLVRA
jgi:alkylresorcinol/alkylpyrone synthase